jgi:omega-hydroxy-beta-dihydromenaquinone-9 sulfotransferase
VDTQRILPGSNRRTGDRDPGVTFIVGPARSGTSLLYKVMCLHPDVAWISNWVARYPRLPQLAVLNRAARWWPSRSRQVWFGPDSNAYVYGRRRPLAHRIFPMPVEGEPLYAASGVTRPGQDGPSETFGRLPRAFDKVRSFGGGTHVLSKRIGNNLRIPILARTFPSARFIEMLRDGRAVAYSLSRVDWWLDSPVWWYGSTPRVWQDEGGDPWEICARNWVEELHRVQEDLSTLPAETVHRTRYEDLVADPVQTLQGIRAFMGLPESKRWTAWIRRLAFPDRNEGWRDRLTPAVVARIDSIQREDLDALGYDR